MDFRCRTFLKYAVALIVLLALCIVFYIMYEESIEHTEHPVVLLAPETNVTVSTHGVTAARNETEETSTKQLETLLDYNPLKDKGYRREVDWSEFRGHGNLTAAAADFWKEEECRRVVVFLSHDVILGHILSFCDAIDPSMGLMMVNDVLFFYGRAMEKETTKDEFTVAKKVLGERRCLMAHYHVDGNETRPNLEDTADPAEVGAYEEKDCKVLIEFKMPAMLLLSLSGATGKYAPGKVWATINPWEPLGVVSRIYWYGPRCFRLLVITSYGRSVHAVKVTCGPMENLVISDDTLYYGDALMVRRSRSDRFFIIFNPKRSGLCIKKTLMITYKEGRAEIVTKLKEMAQSDDKDCQKLVNGDLDGATVSKEAVSQLVEQLEHDTFDVEPFGASLKDYAPYNRWSHFNLPMDLGVAVRYYKSKTAQEVRKLVLVVAEGVPLTAAFLVPSPVQGLVMRGDVLYHNTTVMAKKDEDKHKYTTLIKLDFFNCYKKTFLLKLEGDKLVKKDLLVGGVVTSNTDEDCLDLLQGDQLQNDMVDNFPHDTDEMGVPLDQPR